MSDIHHWGSWHFPTLSGQTPMSSCWEGKGAEVPEVSLPRQGISGRREPRWGGQALAGPHSTLLGPDLGPQTASLGFSITVPRRSPSPDEGVGDDISESRGGGGTGRDRWDGTDSAARMESVGRAGKWFLRGEGGAKLLGRRGRLLRHPHLGEEVQRLGAGK